MCSQRTSLNSGWSVQLASDGGQRAHAELVAFRVTHDDVGVLGVVVVSHLGGPERVQPFNLLGCVVAVEIKVHLVTARHGRLRELEGEVDPLTSEYTEVVVGVT